MKPLHRLANWDIAAGKAPNVALVVGWALTGWFAYGCAAWSQGDKQGYGDNRALAAFLVTVIGVVVLVSTLYRLWQWEERHIADQRKIERLENELAMSPALEGVDAHYDPRPPHDEGDLSWH